MLDAFHSTVSAIMPAIDNGTSMRRDLATMSMIDRIYTTAPLEPRVAAVPGTEDVDKGLVPRLRLSVAPDQ